MLRAWRRGALEVGTLEESTTGMARDNSFSWTPDEEETKGAKDDIFYEGPADPSVLSKWDNGSPSSAWYSTKFNKRRKPVGSRKCGIALTPVDVVILVSSLLLLSLVQYHDTQPACSTLLADLSFLRREMFRCKAAVRDAKLRMRGKEWARESGCRATPLQTLQFLNYTRGQACPGRPLADAESLLVDAHCHDVPRRLCLSPSPPHAAEPLPLPAALWSAPNSSSVAWEEYPQHGPCTQFACLDDPQGPTPAAQAPPGHTPTSAMRLPHPHTQLFNFSRAAQSGLRVTAVGEEAPPPTIPNVLALKEPGVIRTGVDVGGGTAHFAAEMALKGVTIVTTGSNHGFPLLEAIAQRGLPALHLSVTARLPFFEGALDLLHCSHWPSEVTEDLETLEAVFFEWDRVIRPGGIMWLDHLPPRRSLLLLIVEITRVLGYRRRRWRLRARKPLTKTASDVLLPMRRFAVLEKPLRQHFG